MEITKQLGSLIEQATSDSHQEPPLALYEKILALINSRVDMPKHTLNAVSKRISIKNKKVLFYCFDLLEFLSYRCELALYSQISTKEFLIKTSSLLTNQDIDPSVHTKILQTAKCWEELFRPHEDLLPMYFQFYAGLLRKEFPIQKDYVSPHKPKDFKIQRQKVEQKKQQQYRARPSREKAPEPTKSQQKTFEQIREKIILTNQIMDNTNPAQSVKQNALLLEMIEQIKACQKKINQTINANPNEKIMELALAANDDIYITFRRFKDLQKNRKPEPFILTELASDLAKEKEVEEQRKIQQAIKKTKINDEFQNFNQPTRPAQPKVQEKPKKSVEIDIMDLACEPPSKPQKVSEPMDLISLTTDNSSLPKPESSSANLFDLLGGPNQVSPPPPPTQNISLSPNAAWMESNYLAQPKPQGNGFTLQDNFQSGLNNNINISLNQPYQSNAYPNLGFGNSFTTENDIQKYDDRSILDKLTDLTEDLRQNRKQ